MRKCLHPLLLGLLVSGCGGPVGSEAHLTVVIRHALHRKVVVEAVAVRGSGSVRLDSAEVETEGALLEFTLPVQEERPCRILVENAELDLPFVLTPGATRIEADLFLPSLSVVEGTAANRSLHTHLAERRGMLGLAAAYGDTAESTEDSVMRERYYRLRDSLSAAATVHTMRYADSVASPGAFLLVASSVDFGRAYDSLRAFTGRAAARFPRHAAVRRFVESTQDFLKTYEVEYGVGDSLPPLSLPDLSGKPAAVLEGLRGRYVLVDLWSTACIPCLGHMEPKRRLSPYTAADLTLVNIALDTEVDTWRFMVHTQGLPGRHHIDVGMWSGPLIRAWRIDSLPYNLLLGPDGRIMRKAIPADSLERVVLSALRGR